MRNQRRTKGRRGEKESPSCEPGARLKEKQEPDHLENEAQEIPDSSVPALGSLSTAPSEVDGVPSPRLSPLLGIRPVESPAAPR